MPQGDYEGALKRALYISAEWQKIFNTGKGFCGVVEMLMQAGWDAATVHWVRFYDPNRCGIGFHPLHSYFAVIAYLAMTATAKTRLVGVGLVIHMALDGLDCLWMG